MNRTLEVAELMAVPEHRRRSLAEVKARMLGVRHIALTTHLNADGDGTGSQAAVAAWLGDRGIRASIINPTLFPEHFRFLLPPDVSVADWGGQEAQRVVREAELLLVLDTSEPRRIEPLADHFPRERILVIDHHPPGPVTVADVGLLDHTAAATGELVYDLLRLDGESIPDAALVGLYVALVTDTGSFRYSNTTPRTHLITADLLARGVDPEVVYTRLYATVPRRRVDLLREALKTLNHEPETGSSWIVVHHALIDALGVTSEDLDGLVEHARSLEGTRVAMLFRETPEGNTKVSFRSNGPADVNRIARRFEGGGHVKASGATVPGPPDDVVPRVLAAVREDRNDEC
jgi:bifunctional oligoribonuclease and PAP phosphatase NrnA